MNKLIVLSLASVLFSSLVQAATIQKCNVICDDDLETRDASWFTVGLPSKPPKTETNLNCFKPVLACTGELQNCSTEKIQVQWSPNKESQLKPKTITASCEKSEKIGEYIKADLGVSLLSQSHGTFTVSAPDKKVFYYKAVTGE
ncbi:hypothetical protein D3C87_1225740 [compost metagenome]